MAFVCLYVNCGVVVGGIVIVVVGDSVSDSFQ